MKRQYKVPEIVELDFKETSYNGASKRGIILTGISGNSTMSFDCYSLKTYYSKAVSDDLDDADQQPEFE